MGFARTIPAVKPLFDNSGDVASVQHYLARCLLRGLWGSCTQAGCQVAAPLPAGFARRQQLELFNEEYFCITLLSRAMDCWRSLELAGGARNGRGPVDRRRQVDVFRRWQRQ